MRALIRPHAIGEAQIRRFRQRCRGRGADADEDCLAGDFFARLQNRRCDRAVSFEMIERGAETKIDAMTAVPKAALT